MVKSILNSAYYKQVVKRFKGKTLYLLYKRVSKCSRCQNDFTPLKRMGYHIKHVTDVDVLTTSTEINIKNK